MGSIFGLALTFGRRPMAAAALAVALLAVPATANAATLVGGNGVYKVHVLDANSGALAAGTFTLTTGPSHPIGDGKNLLYGNPSGTPGTSFTTVRSYANNTEYSQKNGVAASGGFTISWLGNATPTVQAISGGFRTTYTAGTLTIAQEVTVVGTTVTDSRIIVATKVTNTATAAANVGVRYLWDYQIGTDDGPTFERRGPDGPVEKFETAYAPVGFETYEITDNDSNPSPPTYSVLGTADGPTGLSPAPTPPDVLQTACWGAVTTTAFDYAPTGSGGNFSDKGTPGACGDLAVNYLWGTGSGIPLAPNGGETTVSASPVASAGEDTPLGDPDDNNPDNGGNPPPTNNQPGSKRGSAVTVGCNRGPDPTDDFVCRATVDGTPGGPLPSGYVTWRTQKGFFRYSNRCLLSTPLTGGVKPSCGVVLAQGKDRIPAGSTVPVVARYDGNTDYASSESKPPKAGQAPIEHFPSVCFHDLFRPTATPTCLGYNMLMCPRTTVKGNVVDYLPSGTYVGPTEFGPPKPGSTPCFVGASPASAAADAAPASSVGYLSRRARRRTRRPRHLPKHRGDLYVSVRHLVSLSGKTGRKVRRALRASGLRRLARRRALLIGSKRATIPFAHQRVLKVLVRKPLRRVVRRLRRAGVRSLPGRLRVSVLRGDGRRRTRSARVVIVLPRR